MKKPVFTGANVAIVTPFDESGVNFPVFAQLIEEQIAGGTQAITVCGTTGEAPTLSDEEHKKAISFCLEQVNGRVPVVAGTGSNDTAYGVELTKFAAREGADAVLAVTPYYNKATQKGLIKYFTALADASDTPVILYHVPSRTNVTISIDTYCELAKHPNINGVKEASSDFSLMAKIAARCGDELNFWSGNDDQTVAMMALGAKGVISVLSNVAPSITRKLTDLCLAGDFKTATALQSQYLDLMNDLFIEVNPIPVKTAMNLMGKNVGELRLPLCEMSEGNLKKLEGSLRQAGLI